MKILRFYNILLSYENENGMLRELFGILGNAVLWVLFFGTVVVGVLLLEQEYELPK
ncbi:hypothetical protein NTGZN8_120021 [Candidatus Nitrotoga fabula]|uniref:Uncharacterized protein n=1 Tax=Candidatus Nitrotoga fabula TaxID=2182327 RepID=A0A916BBH9_9PROT|nr:hypothetical protein NTGZN8_120021 [Candidatus Nitrotoga fabula]